MFLLRTSIPEDRLYTTEVCTQEDGSLTGMVPPDLPTMLDVIQSEFSPRASLPRVLSPPYPPTPSLRHPSLSPPSRPRRICAPVAGTDLQDLYFKIRTQFMLQSRGQRGRHTVHITVPCGILDLTQAPAFTALRHTFETGNRHLSIQTALKSIASVEENIGLSAFTVARNIGVQA